MKPGKHQIKLSKEKNPHFYNVASSYQHLIDNIGYDIKKAKESNSIFKISLLKNTPSHQSQNINNHSFNFSKLDSNTNNKKNLITTSFDVGNEKLNCSNKRLGAETGTQKERERER